MLYLDDIQHTHPELLQKFISLCDGSAGSRACGTARRAPTTCAARSSRRDGRQPVHRVGRRFQIPDMLANRADTYNLGDVLAGKRGRCSRCRYLENA